MINNVLLEGRLGQDPTVREPEDDHGSLVVTFSLAHHRRSKTPDGEPAEETTWFDVVTWGKTALFAADCLQKGDRAIVQGRLKIDRWEDSDGKLRKSTEILATRVFPGRRREATDESS